MPLGGDRATATTRATRRTPIGATWYCSTSTSTATPVGGWARVTKPGGPRSSLGASRISRTPARASARHPSPSPIRLQEHPVDHAAEWLEADGLGGFASGTVGALADPARGRYRGRTAAVRPAWVGTRDPVVEAEDAGTGRAARGTPVPFGPRLPRPASRESRLPVRRPARRRRSDLASVRRRP